jgi:hypothetical protein
VSGRARVMRYEVPGGHPIPGEARFVHFGYQSERDTFSAWFEVPESSTSSAWRDFSVIATGQLFTGRCLASVVMPDGFHVFHLVVEPTP